MEEEPKVEPTHIYCDSARIVTSKEIFLLALRSGGNLWAFMFNPHHMKQLYLVIKDQVEKYEATYGTIEATLLEVGPVLSSIQPGDLEGDDKKGE